MLNSNLLKAKMVENDLTQELLAIKLDIAVTSLRNKINGKTEFKRSEMQVLKEILHLNNVEFFDIFFAR